MQNLNKAAASATLHCLTGCAIGEVFGVVIGAALGWEATPTIAMAVALAFIFGYVFSMRPLLKHLSLSKALKVALAADTASIATMEIADNAFLLAIPGAMEAGLNTVFFWSSLALSLVVAFFVAFPVNRYLIARGRGHSIAHQYHKH